MININIAFCSELCEIDAFPGLKGDLRRDWGFAFELFGVRTMPCGNPQQFTKSGHQKHVATSITTALKLILVNSVAMLRELNENSDIKRMRPYN